MHTNKQPPHDDDWMGAHIIRLNVPENTPQPINVRMDGEYVSITKQDVVICRFRRDDADSLLAMARLLTGMHRAGLIFEEMKHLKNIVCEFLRDANGS